MTKNNLSGSEGEYSSAKRGILEPGRKLSAAECTRSVLTNVIRIPGTLDRAENVLFALTVFATPESGYRSKASGPASTRPIWGKGRTNLPVGLR